jgi:hypothetical protein
MSDRDARFRELDELIRAGHGDKVPRLAVPRPLAAPGRPPEGSGRGECDKSRLEGGTSALLELLRTDGWYGRTPRQEIRRAAYLADRGDWAGLDDHVAGCLLYARRNWDVELADWAVKMQAARRVG